MKILGNCVCTNASAQELPVLRPRSEQPPQPQQQQQSDEQSLRDEIDELREQWHFPESATGAVAEPEQQTHRGRRPARFKHKHASTTPPARTRAETHTMPMASTTSSGPLTSSTITARTPREAPTPMVRRGDVAARGGRKGSGESRDTSP